MPPATSGPGRASETERPEDATRLELADRFDLEAVLRRDRWSVYHTGREVSSRRRVVVRVLSRRTLREAGLEGRFRRAVETAALEHPHIVPIHECGATRSFVWYSMRWIDGRSLAAILREVGTLDLETCVRMTEQVTSALAFAHRRGIVHGALRPHDILLDHQGWVFVSGFQVGTVLDALPHEDEVDGYRPDDGLRPPEETYLLNPTPAGDQYTLAVIVERSLVGTLPPALDQWRGRGSGPTSGLAGRRREVPSWVGDVLRRASNARPEDRYPTIEDFGSALGEGDPGHFIHPALSADPLAAARGLLFVDNPRRRGGRFVLALALLLGSVAAVGLTGHLRSQDGEWRLAEILRPRPEPPAPIAPAEPVESLPLATARESLPPLDRLPSSSARAATEEPAGSTGGRSEQAAAPTEVARPKRTAPSSEQTAREAPRAPTRPVTERSAEQELGRLYVNSIPWSYVYLNGQPVGNTPVLNLPLTSGWHHVRVVRAGFQPFEQDVYVSPGQELRLVDIILEALP